MNPVQCTPVVASEAYQRNHLVAKAPSNYLHRSKHALSRPQLSRKKVQSKMWLRKKNLRPWRRPGPGIWYV